MYQKLAFIAKGAWRRGNRVRFQACQPTVSQCILATNRG